MNTENHKRTFFEVEQNATPSQQIIAIFFSYSLFRFVIISIIIASPQFFVNTRYYSETVIILAITICFFIYYTTLLFFYTPKGKKTFSFTIKNKYLKKVALAVLKKKEPESEGIDKNF